MRISGTEPSFKKKKSDAQKVPKQAKAIRVSEINPHYYNFY